jgi:N6-L-threonylcarbamoyladenine synthase
VLAGGVAANSHLRKRGSELADSFGVKLYLPPLSLCGDNAAMIAARAITNIKRGFGAAFRNAFATKAV